MEKTLILAEGRYNTTDGKTAHGLVKEYGIVVEVVDEAFTSKLCPLCGKPHNGARFVRGLYKCPATGLTFNADLVGAFNILRKVVRTITPSLPGLTAGRGNGGRPSPRG